MIRLQQVVKRYENGHEALKTINLQIEKGEMLFLTGQSGAGKTTLLKSIALLEPITAGKIFFEENDTDQLTARHLPYFRRNFGFIFQDPQLLHDRSVFDNVALPLIMSGIPHREIKRRVIAALDKVGLREKEKNPPAYLSTGEQQRINIARAVVHKPLVLLADEPTGNLDPVLANEMMELFQRFNDMGMTIFLASHDLNLIARMKYRILFLNQGQLVGGNA